MVAIYNSLGRMTHETWYLNSVEKARYIYAYNRRNNGDKKKRAELGLDTEGYCDATMVAEWKMELMAKTVFENLWIKRLESIQLAVDLIKQYNKIERDLDNKSDHINLRAKIDKAQARLKGVIAMRADGEIDKEEYQTMRTAIDEEIKVLQNQLEDVAHDSSRRNNLNLDGILTSLRTVIEFKDSKVDHGIVDQFVYKIMPISEHEFDWYLNLNDQCNVRAKINITGHKKKCVIALEEIEKISSLHRMAKADMISYLLNTPSILTLLHRQL